MTRKPMTGSDRRALQVLAERAGRLDLVEKLEEKPVSRSREAGRARREEKLERQRLEMTRLREKVFERAAGKGELCGERLHPEPGQLCHLEGGFGRRRQKQRLDNCVAEHEHCHRSLDREPLAWLANVRAWANRYGYALPARFDKLHALLERYELDSKREIDH